MAVTGLGLLTALGTGTEPTWRAILDGRSAVRPLVGMETGGLTSRIGAQIGPVDPEAYGAARRNSRTMTPGDEFAFVAATLALRDAGFAKEGGFEATYPEPDRLALYIGGDKEWGRPAGFEAAVEAGLRADGTVDIGAFGEAALSTVYPLMYVEGLPGASLFYISQTHRLTGPNTYFSGSSDMGLAAVGTAFRTIRRGEADLALAGAFDEGLNPWSMSRFDSFGILSDRNDLAAGACRPYDRDRTGAVMGEGAAFLVLEDLDRARRRGARIYAEIAGYGAASDGYRMVTPHPAGRGTRHAIEAALADGGIRPEAVDYVATHGSATRLGDVTEAAALKDAFGPHSRRLAASSVKPATGHLAAAAGVLSLATAVLALADQVLPPTLNLENSDPACDLDWVPGTARKAAIRVAVAFGRGFQGEAGAIVVKAAE